MTLEQLRQHQSDVQLASKQIAAGKGKTILAHVVPGGGKSWLPALAARELPRGIKIGWFVPRINLRHQAAIDAIKKMNLTLKNQPRFTIFQLEMNIF